MSIDPDEFAARKQSFGATADDYDRTRPDYIPDAVAWCLEPAGAPPRRVVDLGAGTGKLTRVLLALGHEVIAVEPDEAMRMRLVAALGDEERLAVSAGTAESIPVDDASVDAVVAGQAWHWFDEDVVAPECARVLRAGGVVAALWNTRDKDVDWVQAWSEAVEEGSHPTGRKLVAADGGPNFGAGFDDREDATFRYDQRLTRNEVVLLASTRSYTISLPDDERRVLLNDVRELVDTHPDLIGRDTVSLPYVVECYRAVRRG